MNDFVVATNLDLSVEQKKAALLLGIGQPPDLIYTKVKCTKEDLENWFLNKDFLKYLSEVMTQSYFSTVRKAIGACNSTMDFLNDTIENENIQIGQRLAAAKIVLAYADAYKDFELELRLADIEKQLS